MNSAYRLAIGLILTPLLYPGVICGQMLGFQESFDGQGGFSSTNVVVDGFDNDGWYLSGEGTLESGGFAFNLLSQPEEAHISVLSRSGAVGTESVSEQVEIRELILGDVTGLNSPDSTSQIELWLSLGDATIACAVGKTTGDDIFTSKTTAFCSSSGLPPETHRIDVPDGTNVYLGLYVDFAHGSYKFTFDSDVYDDTPAMELGPIYQTIPFSLSYTTQVRMVAGGQGSVRGRLDNWNLGPAVTIDGDFDVNGALDIQDVNLLIGNIGRDAPRYDVNSDNVIDNHDLAYWLHDLKHTFFGDADLDGKFDSADMINIFQAGEYEDDVVGNSTWSSGDWDADGDFTTSDLVMAFQDGGYEQWPRQIAASVPEPLGVWSFVVGAFALLLRTRHYFGCQCRHRNPHRSSLALKLAMSVSMRLSGLGLSPHKSTH